MLTTTMLNQKGGVGKTSTTHHLSGTLASMGYRVLLIDNDPQSSLTQGFYGPDAARDLDPSETIASIYAGHRPFGSQVIRSTGIAGIDLIPGSRAAGLHNVPAPEFSDPQAQSCIRDFLRDVRDDYDHVFIDCPPNLHLCSWAALVASDFLVVPLQPENYGAQGIRDVHESMEQVQAGPNPDLRLAGYLLTMVASEAIHKVFQMRLRQSHGPKVFEAMVPRSAAYKEAIASLKPIQQYKPKSAASKAIRAVADEFLARTGPDQVVAMREAS